VSGASVRPNLKRDQWLLGCEVAVSSGITC
jgi:hypothetical protein